MGMFDYVRCDRLKPGDAEAFQSKDLERDLDMLWITDSGRLLSVDRSTWYHSQLQSSERDNPAIYKDLNYNGLFDFYGDLEYRAQFLNGQLIGIWRIEDFRKVYTYEEWRKWIKFRQKF